MVGAAGIEHVGEQQRVVERRHLDAALHEDVPVVLHVVGDLQHARVFEQRPQLRQHGGGIELALDQRLAAEEVALAFAHMQHRHVDGIALPHTQGEPDEIGGERVEARCLGVDGDMAGLERHLDHGVERVEARDHDVARGVERRAEQLFGAGGGERAGARFNRGLRRLLAVAGVLRRPVERLRIAGDLLALAVAPAGLPGEGGIGVDIVGLDPKALGGAAGQRREFQRLEIGNQRRAVRRGEAEIVERHLERDVALQPDQFARQLDELDAFGIGQRLALLRLLDLFRA